MQPLFPSINSYSRDLPVGIGLLLEKQLRLKRIADTLENWLLKNHHALQNYAVASLHQAESSQHGGEVLTIISECTATASKLKNLSPSLVACLKGHNVSDIRIKIQRFSIESREPFDKKAKQVRTINPAIADKLRNTEPESPVGIALRHLLDRADIR